MRDKNGTARTLAEHAIEGALSRKASDVVLLDLRDVSGVADYFVICSGKTDVQMKAIAEAVQMEIRDETGERAWRREGVGSGSWTVLDYVDVVVHIFEPEKREFYDLERLWGDAPREEFADEPVSSTQSD